MSILIFTDLHFTNRPRDAYRFGLFDFIIEKIEQHKPSLALILGDLTDEKDNHASRLVNRIVAGLTRIANLVPVVILKGNHDYYADPASPFFGFLNEMENIKFVLDPETYTTKSGKNLFLIPHLHNEEDWDNLKADKRPDYAFIHQTVTGAISESGRRLDGFSLAPLKRLKCPVYGGDVHKPHTIGPVEYVGPPYHVKFGDDFNARCLLLDEKTGKTKNLRFKCPRKWSITVGDPDELFELDYLREGDQTKITVDLTREELIEWSSIKERTARAAAELKLDVYGIELRTEKAGKRDAEGEEKKVLKDKSPKEILLNFCKAEKVPSNIRSVGVKLLEN